MHVSPRRIGLVGDVHGIATHAILAVESLAAQGITEHHFLGDFGFLWNGRNADQLKLKSLRLALERHGGVAFVTGGNHENYDALDRIAPGSDGIRKLTNNIRWLPRGWRFHTSAGRVIASLGGANSIDRNRRRPGTSWWPQEQITEEDLVALGSEPVDILLAHDAPITRGLTGRLASSAHLWSAAAIAYADMGQQMFHRGFTAVQPKLVVSGHYHLHVDTTEDFRAPDGTVFTSRSVILNESQASPYIGILDTETLDVEYILAGDRA